MNHHDDVPQLSDADATAIATDVFGWLEKSAIAGMSRDATIQYLAVSLQQSYTRGAREGVEHFAAQLKRLP